MATVPLSGTNVRMLNDVPFSNDYKNTRWFDDVASQTTYFLNKPVVNLMTQANFQRIEGKTFISVDASIDELWGTNYLMFQNAHYNSKWFYAFVTKLEYKQKKTTYVHFQIDVFQTWMFNMRFKDSYVVREHARLWNDDGTPIVQTIDEGLNYGTEYETVEVQQYIPYDPVYFLVIVTKEAMHNGGAGIPEEDLSGKITPVLNGLPQPLSFYVHPFKLNGDSPDVVIGGDPFNLDPITDVLKGIYTHDDAVNNVVSLYITEYIGQNISYSNDTITINDVNFGKAVIADNASKNLQTLYVKSIMDYNGISKVFPNKYSGYNAVTESKLLMYPYTVLILDDFKGNRVTLKNEYIKGNDLTITVKGSLGTSNKVSYSVDNYNIKAGVDFPHIVNLEHSLINNNPNDVPIITDMLAAYLQGNRNSLENQKDSIMWNGTMGAIGSGVSGVASAAQGNVAGVASGGVDLVSGVGNTVLALQGMEAKKADINNIPPSIAKMGSNSQFDFGNDLAGVFIIKKQITAEYRNKLTDFFHMFGYKVGRVKQPNFHTRQHFNYVQTESCTITGNFNNEDLQELKACFDNGITLWHTDDVGNYALENGVL